MDSRNITTVSHGPNFFKMSYAVCAVVIIEIITFISVSKTSALIKYSRLDKTVIKYIRYLLICAVVSNVVYTIHYLAGIFHVDCEIVSFFGQLGARIIYTVHSISIGILALTKFFVEKKTWLYHVIICILALLSALPGWINIFSPKKHILFCICIGITDGCIEIPSIRKLFFLIGVSIFFYLILAYYLIFLDNRRHYRLKLRSDQKLYLGLTFVPVCLYGVFDVFQRPLIVHIFEEFGVRGLKDKFDFIIPFQYFVGSLDFPLFFLFYNRHLLKHPAPVNRVYPVIT